ncbi:MAG: hypothetical protein QM723_31640 [Myxococcaceae bacterium]
MLTAVLLATTLSAAPVKLAMPGLQSVNVKNQLLLLVNGELAARLREQGLEVVTSKDIELILGFERQKELLGCSDGSCIAELANALGADGVITGTVSMLSPDRFRVLINVVSPSSAQPFASWTGTVEGQKRIPDSLAEAARTLGPQIYSALHRDAPEVAAVAAPPQSHRGPWGFVATGGALGFIGLASGLFISAGQYDSFLRCDVGQPCAVTQMQAQKLHDDGQLMQNLAIGSLVVAAVCAGLAIWLFLSD